MDRYQLFRILLDQVGENFEILDADMNSYLKEIEIQGRCPGWEISLTVRQVEVKEDGN